MPFVVDASVTMSWCFEDEATSYTESVLERLRGSSAAAPAIWPLEVANILLLGERRGRIPRTKTESFVRVLQDLRVSVENESPAKVLGPTLQIGREHGLTSYDASYLELAMRRGLPLATLDRRLADAAREAGVPLVE